MNTLKSNLAFSASALERADRSRHATLLESQKLILVLDLDLTLLHCTTDPRESRFMYSSALSDSSQPNHGSKEDAAFFGLHSFQLEANGPVHYLKLRPGLFQFLEQVAPFFLLHVFTMGLKGYAEEVLKIIDPERKLFGNRVLTRDVYQVHVKDLRMFFKDPQCADIALILDDTVSIWNQRSQVIPCYPYNFFLGQSVNTQVYDDRADTHVVNADVTEETETDDSLAILQRDQVHDRHLSAVGDLVCGIQQQFYQEYAEGSTLPLLNRLITEACGPLEGCKVYIHTLNPSSHVHEFHTQTVRSLHGVIAQELSDAVTHIVVDDPATSLDSLSESEREKHATRTELTTLITTKLTAAAQCFIVNLTWLRLSHMHWRCPPECDYLWDSTLRDVPSVSITQETIAKQQQQIAVTSTLPAGESSVSTARSLKRQASEVFVIPTEPNVYSGPASAMYEAINDEQHHLLRVARQNPGASNSSKKEISLLESIPAPKIVTQETSKEEEEAIWDKWAKLEAEEEQQERKKRRAF